MTTFPMRAEDVDLAKKAVEKATNNFCVAKAAKDGTKGATFFQRWGQEIDAQRDLSRCERLLEAVKAGSDRGGTWDGDDYGFLARMAKE